MNPTVLIADTDVDSREQIRRMLRKYDARVIHAEDAETGFKLFLESSPSLVFIDVFLPRRGGIEFFKRIRSVTIGKTVSVIMLCGVKGLSDLRNEALSDLDARAFLMKPLRDEDLEKQFERVFSQFKEAERISRPTSMFSKDVPAPRGDLDSTASISIFKYLAESRFVGTLHAAADKVQKAVYISDGKILFASSNRVAETLGRTMLEKGLIDNDTYQNTLTELRSSGRKFGEILIERGEITPEEMEKAFRSNIIGKVSAILAWSSGKYVLTPTVDAPPNALADPVSSEQLIWDAVMNELSAGDLMAILGDHLEQYVVVTGDLVGLTEEVEMDEEDRLYAQGADSLSGKTLQQALNRTGTEHNIRVLLALFALDRLSLCETSECVLVHGQNGEEAMERLRTARKTLSIMRGQNYFAVLGVPLETSDQEVKAVFQEKARKYHPDTLPEGEPAELKQVYSDIFVLLRDAYSALAAAEVRVPYLKSLNSSGEHQMNVGSRLLEAETRFQQGMSFSRKRKWAEALPHLLEACRLTPDEAEYTVECGIVIMNLRDGDRAKNYEEALKLFLKAAELDARSPEPYYRMGTLYKLQGDLGKAHEYFHRALSRKPSHEKSRLELRLLGSRKKTGR